MKRSGLIVEIFRSAGLGDCTNGGVTARADQALLLLEEGGPFDEEWAAKAGAPILKVVRRELAWRAGGEREEYLHAEPVDRPREGHVGWMAGGNLVYTSDSRFPNRYPLKVHDRQESRSDHKRLSQ